jgi:undecaprenyl-diphosphatase
MTPTATRTSAMFRRVDALEERFCMRVNRACHRDSVREFFRVVSRLGDGFLWYLLLLLLPVLYGAAALLPAATMAGTAVVGIALYKALKHRLVRERPYVTFAGIRVGTPPLDRYSFPSGHTLHAVAFTTQATAHFPELAWLLVPFAALVAASRVVLGLHYPTDVLAGALLGASLAAAGLAVA